MSLLPIQSPGVHGVCDRGEPAGCVGMAIVAVCRPEEVPEVAADRAGQSRAGAAGAAAEQQHSRLAKLTSPTPCQGRAAGAAAEQQHSRLAKLTSPTPGHAHFDARHFDARFPEEGCDPGQASK